MEQFSRSLSNNAQKKTLHSDTDNFAPLITPKISQIVRRIELKDKQYSSGSTAAA
jgi:hypothetical protein